MLRCSFDKALFALHSGQGAGVGIFRPVAEQGELNVRSAARLDQPAPVPGDRDGDDSAHVQKKTSGLDPLGPRPARGTATRGRAGRRHCQQLERLSGCWRSGRNRRFSSLNASKFKQQQQRQCSTKSQQQAAILGHHRFGHRRGEPAGVAGLPGAALAQAANIFDRAERRRAKTRAAHVVVARVRRVNRRDVTVETARLAPPHRVSPADAKIVRRRVRQALPGDRLVEEIVRCECPGCQQALPVSEQTENGDVCCLRDSAQVRSPVLRFLGARFLFLLHFQNKVFWTQKIRGYCPPGYGPAPVRNKIYCALRRKSKKASVLFGTRWKELFAHRSVRSELCATFRKCACSQVAVIIKWTSMPISFRFFELLWFEIRLRKALVFTVNGRVVLS